MITIILKIVTGWLKSVAYLQQNSVLTGKLLVKKIAVF